jgi:hypothetical protein
MRQPVFQVRIHRLAGQEQVNVLFGDDHAALHLALADARDQHLVAYLFAHGEKVSAVAAQLLGELGEAHAVLAGDIGQHLVELAVVHPDAGLGGALGLQAHQQQALQHLRAQCRFRRHGQPAGTDLLLGEFHRLIELALQDHAVIDHGDDAVQRLGGRNTGYGQGYQQEQGAQRARQRTGHGG